MFDYQGMQTTMRTKEVELKQVKELGDLLLQLSEDTPQVRHCIQSNMANIDEQRNKLDANVKQVGEC